MGTKNNSKNNRTYGSLINILTGLIGIIIIFFAIFLKNKQIIGDTIHTIMLSIGTSIVASSVVSWIGEKYLFESKRINDIIKTWKLCDIYETKAKMNSDSNECLENCSGSIDIIAEGMYNFLDAKSCLLEELMKKKEVRIRIISCDNAEMLIQKSKDESYGKGGFDKETWKILNLKKTVEKWKEKNYHVELKYHSSYPAFSYLRIDSYIFVSPNLWLHPSQQTFAMSFFLEGKGAKYFMHEFDMLWDSKFVHNECELKNVVTDAEKNEKNSFNN